MSAPQEPAHTVSDSTLPPATNQNSRRSGLSAYERSGEGRPPWILTRIELKLLGIAGVGFFLDAYDLFIINPIATMLQYRLYGSHALPAGLQGFIKAGANVGSVIGQFTFGFAADYYGRKAVYGKELMVIIFATIFCISDPTGDLSPSGALIWLGVWRIVLGIGVGGDYPMSASVSTDRARLRKRGTMLAYIFSAQGWGSLVGSLATIIILACYKDVMDTKGEVSKVDGVWRIIIGLSLIPAFGTLYQRLTLPEAKRFEAAKSDTVDEEKFKELEETGDDRLYNKQGVKGAAVGVIHTTRSASSGEDLENGHDARERERSLAAEKKDHWLGAPLRSSLVCS